MHRYSLIIGGTEMKLEFAEPISLSQTRSIVTATNGTQVRISAIGALREVAIPKAAAPATPGSHRRVRTLHPGIRIR